MIKVDALSFWCPENQHGNPLPWNGSFAAATLRFDLRAFGRPICDSHLRFPSDPFVLETALSITTSIRRIDVRIIEAPGSRSGDAP
jgi:hypothetical protein